ncbi:MAG: hypothetical protein IKF47_03345 [Bacilli bacterium]|nr:hypothetical protein [Bacilli bacterium]
MTQKELLYVEDAIGHEKTIIENIQDYINCFQDENLIEFMRKELKTHEKMKKDLIKLLESEAND